MHRTRISETALSTANFPRPLASAGLLAHLGIPLTDPTRWIMFASSLATDPYARCASGSVDQQPLIDEDRVLGRRVQRHNAAYGYCARRRLDNANLAAIVALDQRGETGFYRLGPARRRIAGQNLGTALSAGSDGRRRITVKQTPLIERMGREDGCT